MRENRPYGSEGGVATSHPDPYPFLFGVVDRRNAADALLRPTLDPLGAICLPALSRLGGERSCP